MGQARVALVTGGSRGIGRAVALRLAADGMRVMVNYRRDGSAARAVVGVIERRGGEASACQADVSLPGEVAKVVRATHAELGPIDVAVNNAGIYHRHGFEDLTPRIWSRTLAVDLTGPYLVCRAVLPAMKRTRWGRIVNVSSQLALRGTDHGADYAAAKAGLLGLTRSLALEVAPYGITVNAVAPGTIDTDIIAHYTPAQRRARSRMIPAGRIGEPEDVAAAVAFLASEEASYITGETILVTGGGYIA